MVNVAFKSDNSKGESLMPIEFMIVFPTTITFFGATIGVFTSLLEMPNLIAGPYEFTTINGKSAEHLFFSDHRIYNIYINNIFCKYRYSIMEHNLTKKLKNSEERADNLEKKIDKLINILSLSNIFDDETNVLDKDKQISDLLKENSRLKKLVRNK